MVSELCLSVFFIQGRELTGRFPHKIERVFNVRIVPCQAQIVQAQLLQIHRLHTLGLLQMAPGVASQRLHLDEILPLGPVSAWQAEQCTPGFAQLQILVWARLLSRSLSSLFFW
jgi:hypothetical protein